MYHSHDRLPAGRDRGLTYKHFLRIADPPREVLDTAISEHDFGRELYSKPVMICQLIEALSEGSTTQLTSDAGRRRLFWHIFHPFPSPRQTRLRHPLVQLLHLGQNSF